MNNTNIQGNVGIRICDRLEQREVCSLTLWSWIWVMEGRIGCILHRTPSFGGGVHHQTIEVFQSQKIDGYKKSKWKQPFHTTVFDSRHSCRNQWIFFTLQNHHHHRLVFIHSSKIVNSNDCSMIAMWIIMWSNMAWCYRNDRWRRISKNLVIGSRPQLMSWQRWRMTIAERISWWMLIYSQL